MKIVIAEALNNELVIDEKGNTLCYARALEKDANKYHVMMELLLNSSIISYFLKIGEYLSFLLNNELPLVLVTDWTDPTEMVGLRLESDSKVNDYPNLCFLALYTNWDNIEDSGIKDIFAHEFSHLWLNLLGYSSNLSKSNKFHTCTAITDVFCAFSEGFAEHFEIITRDLSSNKTNSFWDYGYDINAWISLRDRQLRYYGTINNRFVYHTALPYKEDYDTYNHLHFAHLTSSAFTPEKLKNGNQMMASEGVIASVFYQMYNNELLKNTFLNDSFYSQFGADKMNIDSNTNLYLKILYTISKIDLTKPTLMTDFIFTYGELFSNEKKEIYKVFLGVTHYSTISNKAIETFGRLYRIGRRGEVNTFKDTLREATELKETLYNEVLKGKLSLNYTLKEEIWIDSDEHITPVPWKPDEIIKYRFNINTATVIDFLALKGMTLTGAEKLVKIREANCGYRTLEEFYNILRND